MGERHGISGKCKVLIVLRVRDLLLACSVHFVCGRFGRLLWDSVETAMKRRRTKCTEHASKKIRPSKRLELYIFQSIALKRVRAIDPQKTSARKVRAALVEREIGRKFCSEDSDSFHLCPPWVVFAQSHFMRTSP